MIQEFKLDSEKVMGLRIEGKVEQGEYEPVLESLENKLNTAGHINLYMEVPHTPNIPAQAVWDSIKVGLANLKNYNDKLDRVAVVTDKGWLKAATALENALFPGIEERSFSMEEAEEAKNWIQE